MKVEFKCEKCGVHQKKDEQKSNENWKVFKRNESCECGGKYKMHLNGKPV